MISNDSFDDNAWEEARFYRAISEFLNLCEEYGYAAVLHETRKECKTEHERNMFTSAIEDFATIDWVVSDKWAREKAA